MTSIDNLPDELLDHVLSTYCSISPFAFFSNLNSSSPSFPTSAPFQPDPSFLQVCKRWHSVGLPHLYLNVVIKNAAQSKALVHTLSHIPSNFSHTTRVRIEYEPIGEHAVAPALLRLAGRQIVDLCLLVHVNRSVYTEEMLGLGAVSPIRLGIMSDGHESGNAHFEPLSFTLKSMVKCLDLGLWDRLDTVFLPYQSSGPYTLRGVHRTYLSPLMNVQTLRSIHLPCHFLASTLKDAFGPSTLKPGSSILIATEEVQGDAVAPRTISQQPFLLERIHVHGPRNTSDVVLEEPWVLGRTERECKTLKDRMAGERNMLSLMLQTNDYERLRGRVVFSDDKQLQSEVVAGDEWIPCTCPMLACQMFPPRAHDNEV